MVRIDCALTWCGDKIEMKIRTFGRSNLSSSLIKPYGWASPSIYSLRRRVYSSLKAFCIVNFASSHLRRTESFPPHFRIMLGTI
jgi:hypothetical protein